MPKAVKSTYTVTHTIKGDVTRTVVSFDFDESPETREERASQMLQVVSWLIELLASEGF